MKEKHHVGLSGTWWVHSVSGYWLSSWRKAEGQGEVWGSATGVGTLCPSHPCAATCAAHSLSWNYELAAQTTIEELCLLPPAALKKQKGHFNQGGMKGGSQTGDSWKGVAGCLVQMFLTVPRWKDPGLAWLPSVCTPRALKEGAKLHGAHGPASCTWVLPYHGTCGGKRCQMVFPKSRTERGTFCTQQMPAVHKTAFWSLCFTVCWIIVQDSSQKLLCW